MQIIYLIQSEWKQYDRTDLLYIMQYALHKISSRAELLNSIWKL